MAGPRTSASTVDASSEPSCTTISTSFIRCTGLKKCIPISRSGRGRSAAMSAMEMDEVLVARSADGSAQSLAWLITSRLTSRSSSTASMTRSAPWQVARMSGAVCNRPRIASRPAASSLPRCTAPSRVRPIRSRAPCSASGRASVRVVGHPAVAAACAMPAPMVPAPMTATRVGNAVMPPPPVGRDSCHRARPPPSARAAPPRLDH